MTAYPTLKLAEVATVIAGQSPDSKCYNDAGRGMPFYQGKKDFGDKFIGEPSTWTTEVKRVAKAGDVLMSVRAPVGPVNFATAECCIGRGLAAIRSGPTLDKEYLFYCLLAKRDDIEGTEGAVFACINKGQIEAIALPAPPLPEQRRIVAILDEAFAAIATAKTNAEKNLQNAEALVANSLTEALASDDDCRNMPLIDLCSVFVDSAHRTPAYQRDGIPALRPRDIVNGKLSLDGAERVSESEYEIQARRHKPAAGDIVYSRELSYGWAAVLPAEPRVCLSQGMCLFRPNQLVETDYLLLILNGPIGRRQAMRSAVGAAHPHINLSEIKAYRIPVPPLARQRAIARRMTRVGFAATMVQVNSRRKLAALDALKSSLLHHAFSGQLAAREPGRAGAEFLFPSLVSMSPIDLHAGVLALAFQLHERQGTTATLGHVKGEKIAHLAEGWAGIDLGRNAIKDAAGPNDFRRLRAVAEHAERSGYFKFWQNGNRFQFVRRSGFEELVRRTTDVLGERLGKFEQLLGLLAPMTTREVEVVATVFAAWNNLLLEGTQPTNQQIVREARENWHPDKLRIDRKRFFEAITWMKKRGLVPKGEGKAVVAKARELGRSSD